MYLTNKDTDGIIAKHLICSGHPQMLRLMNGIMIMFKNYPKFVNICSERFINLMKRYLKMKNIEEIIFTTKHSNNFWKQTIQKFASGKSEISFTGRQKGKTRAKLYMLGFLFGYSHVGYDEENFEVSSTRGRLRYSEYKLTKNKYTMKELRKMKMNLPDMWNKTDEVDEKGEHYYIKVENGWYKRGIMTHRYNLIKFNKVISTNFKN